ncbi:MAG: DUF885 domain-containing protein [Deltaproteobacteria bacterium]|nr:DUF885 domain-containing protein [Deltaproteobacteria bacterium]
MSVLIPGLIALLVAGCGPKMPPIAAADPEEPPTAAEPVEQVVSELNAAAVAGVEDPALRLLLHDHWEYRMSRSPLWATALGDTRYDDQLGDWSQAGVEEGRAAARGFLERAEGIDAAGLSGTDALTLEVFRGRLAESIRREVWEYWQWSISPRTNPLVDLSYVPEAHTVEDPEDAGNLLSRYRQMAGAVDDTIANLRVGLASGRVANRETVALIIEQMEVALAKPLEEWPLTAPARAAYDFEWDPEAREAYRAELNARVADEIRPALERYLALLRDEVLPVARPPERVGVWALPDGEACYRTMIRSHTTVDLGANALHQTGLDELQSIHAEMLDLGEAVFGTRDLAAIFDHLRTDPALRFETSEEVEARAEEATAAAKAAMPAWFGRLPRADIVVRRIPDYEAPYTYIAYYREPAPDGSKPGEYFVNVYAPETRRRFEAEVLAFHEGIPGHHLQIAIAQELPDTPAFRRHIQFSAFLEGWALYTERLAVEMGLYSGDLDRLGMLSFDSWRASRLVVDTGIHARGWTREQAEQFMMENTPLAENNIVNEVDRYISWPGQALAYKVGQIHIRRLRAEAEEALGEAFDLPAFHDVVLGAGAVPLPVLERRVHAWIERRSGGTGSTP